ncbi:hypothetical protein YC2023_114892 [Brassica napus]
MAQDVPWISKRPEFESTANSDKHGAWPAELFTFSPGKGLPFHIQLILSEFVPNGSFYDHLHYQRSSHGNTEFNWQRRFEVALGTAKALSFLDERYQAKLSDYGLEKFFSFGLTKFHNAVMKLDLVCTTENPGKRPSMGEVVKILELIRNGMRS